MHFAIQLHQKTHSTHYSRTLAFYDQYANNASLQMIWYSFVLSLSLAFAFAGQLSLILTLTQVSNPLRFPPLPKKKPF